MIKSMTAYGRGECALGDNLIIVEIKAVNHRFRDLSLRLPKTLQFIEDEIRSQIASRVERGRIEISIQMEKNGGEAGYQLELNLPLARAYFQILQQLSDEFGLKKNIGPDYISQMKDVIKIKPEVLDIEGARSALQTALGQALDSLEEMRVQEGRFLEADFRQRIDRITTYLAEVEEKSPQIVVGFSKRLKNKIAKISQGIELDENRLMTEVAIFAERSDITEEIVRTRSHLQQFCHYMSSEAASGRRLDFLIQEINREANTMSNKANDSAISVRVVEIKAELEKLREQVQNVE